MSEWSKDQEEYAEQQFQLVEERKREFRTLAKEAATRKAGSSDEEETPEQRRSHELDAKERKRELQLEIKRHQIQHKYHPDLHPLYEDKRFAEERLRLPYKGEKVESMETFLSNKADWQRQITYQEEQILRLETARDREIERTLRELKAEWFKEDHSEAIFPEELMPREENSIVLKVQAAVEARRKQEEEERQRRYEETVKELNLQREKDEEFIRDLERENNAMRREKQRKKEELQRDIERNLPPTETDQEKRSRRNIYEFEERWKLIREWDAKIQEATSQKEKVDRDVSRYDELKKNMKNLKHGRKGYFQEEVTREKVERWTEELDCLIPVHRRNAD
jgi:hypothetical protein